MLLFATISLSLTYFCDFFINSASANISISSAESMITIEAESGRVLYAKDENKRLPMASTTKILTAIVAIENVTDLDAKFEIPKEAVGIEGSSIYLRKGEHLSVRELLYGLMLRSGNDAAVAIAFAVSGSVEEFVKLVNNFVESLNLKNTHIVTVNGLHDNSHYTSAFDLSKITAYAMKNEVFKEIVSCKEKTISNELGKKNEKYRFLKNKNRLLKMIDGADGVKTGYTRKAGRCFVGSATRNEMQIIVVVLNCAPMFEETAKLIEKAFTNFERKKLFSKGEIIKAKVLGDEDKEYPIILKKDIYYPLSKDELNNVTAKLIINKNLKTPVSTENHIGSISVTLENNLIFSENIYTIDIEENKDFEWFIKKIIKAF